ncbi:hypothetical protein AHAS_Ahas02G0071200 [Arachis hypogaea]
MNFIRKLAEEEVPQTNNPRPYSSTSNQTAGSTVSFTASLEVTFLKRRIEYTVLWLVGGARLFYLIFYGLLCIQIFLLRVVWVL